MSIQRVTNPRWRATAHAAKPRGTRIGTRKIENTVLLVITLTAAAIWIFPLYWAFVTSIRDESHVVSSDAGLLPDMLNLTAYSDALFNSNLLTWYVNSIGTSIIITVTVLITGMMCAYALSQMRFPGRRALYAVVLASFMIPTQALVVTQFVLMNDLGLVNTWAGIILPQLIVPVVIIVYKQFFDAVPKEMREAVLLDGGGEYTLLFKVYLPLNWGITTALAIITFIMAWNQFFWPFLVTTSENMMTIPVGITQVRDTFGVNYARVMAVALLGAAPVAIAYLIFQKKVTEAVMISSGVKG
ncbi:carbohydrate ABC transporter permease [Vreelandella nigrificans]|uniref:carbohydrate ABC transporter permease n=1 Tax=Vreelandella nigrificans TaxID=2042704 RepID=UPI001AD844FE|nr:carbohydrate ABC transporter permease [Halomonas nigrificans]